MSRNRNAKLLAAAFAGTVNTADFTFLVANFNASVLPGDALSSAAAVGTLVPEPTTLALAGLGVALGFRRKRRG